MDHVRGSSLAWPATLDTLRPFVLTWWSGRTVQDMPADIRAVYDTANFGGQHINIALVILDENGKHLRASIPAVRPPAFRFDPESQGRDFKRQLDELVRGLTLPKIEKPEKPVLALPTVCSPGKPNGVRIYLTAEENRMNHYRTPIVEAVPLTSALRIRLQYPDIERTLSAADLKPWLEQIYPAAIMDGKGDFRGIEGKFSFKPAGQDETNRFATITGTVDFELDNTSRTSYRGDLSIVLKYPLNEVALAAVRGVVDFTVPKGPERIKLTAAIESLPE